ncbi:MAG TPA: chorismate lyase [Gammaproteobacteria bacterium]|nr:chorismate lyase [Gammaproteobacteria bacterium]
MRKCQNDFINAYTTIKPIKKSQVFHSKINQKIPFILRDWVSYKGSLIKRLKKCGVEDVCVELLEQTWKLPDVDERNVLAIRFREFALVREVFIRTKEKYWIFARTIFPRQTLTGRERCFLRLKNKSLGSILFKDTTLQRSEFEMMCLRAGTLQHKKISQTIKRILPDLWARRSLFYLHGKSLLLTEIFLPAMETLECLKK